MLIGIISTAFTSLKFSRRWMIHLMNPLNTLDVKMDVLAQSSHINFQILPNPILFNYLNGYTVF